MKLLIRSRLRDLLEERGISQRKFAKMCGVEQGALSRFDAQLGHDDTVNIRIAWALGIPLQDLFEVIEVDDGEDKVTAERLNAKPRTRVIPEEPKIRRVGRPKKPGPAKKKKNYYVKKPKKEKVIEESPWAPRSIW